MAHTSILTILSISFERYYAICNPFEVLYACTKRRALKIITAVWAFSLAAAFPLVFMTYTRRSKHINGEYVTICTTPVRGQLRISYIISKMVLFFLLPLLILIVLYALICRRLMSEEIVRMNRDHGEHLPMTNGQVQVRTRNNSRPFVRSSTRTHNSRRQVIYMLITIIILFFICLLPIKVIALWSIFGSHKAKENLDLEGYLNVMYFTRIMFYLNSAGNPVLYNIVSTKFRDACRRALHCRKRLEKSNSLISRQYTHMSHSTIGRTTICKSEFPDTHQSSLNKNKDDTATEPNNYLQAQASSSQPMDD